MGSKRRERTLLVVGAGGLGQDVAEIACLSGRYTKIVFLDDAPNPEKERQYHIVGGVDDLEKFVGHYEYAIAAVGNNEYRLKVHNRIKRRTVCS